jgi:hypothetical protein
VKPRDYYGNCMGCGGYARCKPGCAFVIAEYLESQRAKAAPVRAIARLSADCDACSIVVTVERVTAESLRAHAWFVESRKVRCPSCGELLEAVARQ